MRVKEVSVQCMKLVLNAIGREFGEQGGVPDCIQSSREVKQDSRDLVSGIEDAHPLPGELEQHHQSRV